MTAGAPAMPEGDGSAGGRGVAAAGSSAKTTRARWPTPSAKRWTSQFSTKASTFRRPVSPHEGHVLARAPVEERRELGAQAAERDLLVAEDAPLPHRVAQGGDVHRRPVPLDGRHDDEDVAALEAEAPLLVEVEEVRVRDGGAGLHHHVGQGQRAPEDGLACRGARRAPPAAARRTAGGWCR